MKVQLEMELADLLRISVLLDHHRHEAVSAAGDQESDDPRTKLWTAWSAEAAELNRKLLSAISRKQQR